MQVLCIIPLGLLSVLACIFSGTLTCFYGAIVYSRGVDDVRIALNSSSAPADQDYCIFNT